MKTFFKKFFVLFYLVFSVITVSNFLSAPRVSAADGLGSCRDFLGMTSWDCGINPTPGDQDALVSNIVIIAANILNDAAILAAYLVLGYTIYGGYLYIFASGDPGKAMAGKKTLIHAFIGLAIVMSSSIILNSIRIAFLGTSGSFAVDCINTECVDPNIFVTNVIQWFIGIAGAVAAVFVVIGGIGYVTSTGDPGKIQKSRKTITYALIGLTIVALAEIITAFVSNQIRSATAEPTSFIKETIIAKEIYEK